jgi:hypothetical protein
MDGTSNMQERERICKNTSSGNVEGRYDIEIKN